jgi:hypothetical protein
LLEIELGAERTKGMNVSCPKLKIRLGGSFTTALDENIKFLGIFLG